MKILIAPNAFKHSLDAGDVARALEKGISRSSLNCEIECFPVGDGGDGTGNLLMERLGSTRVEVSVQDPLGKVIDTFLGVTENGRTAVIEMANASGLRLIGDEDQNPLQTSTFGLGQLISRALDLNVTEIIIGLGGSATVDGGAGMLNALGVRFFDDQGAELKATPQGLASLSSIDISGLDPRLSKCSIIALCDVDNRLLGTNGAAAVFGPQKGARSADIQTLDDFLERLSSAVLHITGKDMNKVVYGGAAGGVAAALHAVLGAQLVNGAFHFLDLASFEDSLGTCDLVITGEGKIDGQTSGGKAPYAVARLAKERGIPVIGIAGQLVLEDEDRLSQYFDALVPISNGPSLLEDAIKNTEANLVRTGEMIARLILLSFNK